MEKIIKCDGRNIESDLEAKLYIYRKEIDSFCERFDGIYIYGTGHFADIAYRFFLNENVLVKGFLVSPDIKADDIHYNIRVFPMIKDVVKENEGIVVAVWDHKDVDRLIMKCGVKNNQVIHWYCEEVYTDFPGSDYQNRNVRKSGPFFDRYSELNSIGEKTGTDKARWYHNYLDKYDFFLSGLKNKLIKIVELGIFKGESLEMWKAYFDNAKIIGVDIDESSRQYFDNRTEIMICDLSSEEELEKLSEHIGFPQIIIDDASHIHSHQIKALIRLFPRLDNGGIYILEDLGTSFGENLGTMYDDSTITAYEFCSLIAEKVTGCGLNGKREETYFSDLAGKIADEIDMVAFIQGSCIMVKA